MKVLYKAWYWAWWFTFHSWKQNLILFSLWKYLDLFMISLRGRRLKGKGKKTLGKGSFSRERNARGARGRREGGSRALIPFPFPFERLPRRLIYDKRRDTSLFQLFLMVTSRRGSARQYECAQLHIPNCSFIKNQRRKGTFIFHTFTSSI